MARNYKREYSIETPARRAARAERNRARRIEMNKGLAAVGDNKDVGHIKAISKGGGNNLSNLEMQTPSSNRSFHRNAQRKLVSELSPKERKKHQKAVVVVGKRKK